MNDVLKSGGTTVDLIWKQNDNNYGIRVLAVIERPYEQTLPEDPRLAAYALARSAMLNTTQKGFEVKPTSHLHSINVEKFPEDFLPFVGEDMKSAESLMDMNIVADDFFKLLGEENGVQINVVETTSLEWLEFRFGKLMAQKGEEFWDWALDKIVKRSSADSDGNQFYLFNGIDPIFKFTELVPKGSAAAQLGHNWTEYTHRISLSWKFGMNVEENIVDTREEVKAAFKSGQTKPAETTTKVVTPGGQVQQKINEAANAETTA